MDPSIFVKNIVRQLNGWPWFEFLISELAKARKLLKPIYVSSVYIRPYIHTTYVMWMLLTLLDFEFDSELVHDNLYDDGVQEDNVYYMSIFMMSKCLYI